MGSVRFQQRKICWRLLPSAARVRPASAAAHNSPSVRCTPLAYANDLTPCRMALHFDYASAAAPTSSKRPAPTATRGSSYTAPLSLRFLYSFDDNFFICIRRGGCLFLPRGHTKHRPVYRKLSDGRPLGNTTGRQGDQSMLCLCCEDYQELLSAASRML